MSGLGSEWKYRRGWGGGVGRAEREVDNDIVFAILRRQAERVSVCWLACNNYYIPTARAQAAATLSSVGCNEPNVAARTYIIYIIILCVYRFLSVYYAIILFHFLSFLVVHSGRVTHARA